MSKPGGNGKSSLSPSEAILNYVRVAHTIDNPDDQTPLNRKIWRGLAVLCCPVCGNGFSHVQSVYTLIGGDESEGLYHGSHLVARETPHRRDAIAVRVHGETCGHLWDLVFQQHKGNTLTRIDVIEDDRSGTALKERCY